MDKKYKDSRGWKYQAMGGIVDNAWKARYQRAEQRGHVGWKGVDSLPWRESREKAQADLERLAGQKGRTEWDGGGAKHERA